MSQKMTCFLLWLLLLVSQFARADIVLPGQFLIGDNTSNGLRPTTMVSTRLSAYVPVNPIHFSISHPVTLSELRLESATGLDAGANFVIWDSLGNIVLNEKANDYSRDRVSRYGGWSLTPGEYKMAVWGGCFLNGYYLGSYDPYCNDWDDFSFKDIRLVTNGATTAFHFIERSHIGENIDATRWYPPAPSGTYILHQFTLNKRSQLNTLTLYNLRDWGVNNGSRMFIRPVGSVYTPLVYYFNNNGDVNWNINYELAAGNYELWIETVNARDRDDISWDDIVLRYTPKNDIPVLDDLCTQVFPYPAQGRGSSDRIDFSGNTNYTAGLLFGSQGGLLGYGPNGQIKGTSGLNCDNGTCVAAGLVKSWSGAPSSRFPLAVGSNITVGFAETRFLTAVEGNLFGTISTAHQSQINIENSGISIKVLDLGSGRGGRDYTVKLAAGDYWIETLNMGNDTSIIVDGPVRIFVKNLNMGSASYINSPGTNIAGDISKLLVVVYDSAYLANGSTLSGMVYQSDSSAQTINLSSASYLMGRVNGKFVVVGPNSRIDSRSFQCIATAVVDHYEVHYPSSSLTCEPAQVRLAACLDNSCSQLYNGNATISMTPSNGWSSNPVSLGSSGTADITLSSLAAKSVVIGLSSANPSALLRCYRDGVLDSSCSMSFSDAALRLDFSTFYAGSSTNSTIRAIKSNDVGATKVCVPLLTGNQTLQFGSTKVVSDTASNAVPTINGSTISPSGNVNVLFDGNGVGQLTLQYPDAGVLRLDATFQKNDVTGTLKLTGSDTVAVIPKAIALQAQGQSGCSGSNDNTYAACPVYRKAGESFTLQARALNEQDQLTPGFATSNKAISWALLAPAAGGTGTFSPTAISLANGVANNVVANWSEVGVIRLGVSNFVPYPAYQDELPQLETVLRWSVPIGRFVPWDYSLSNGFITPACNAFTYMSQPFASGFVITARNSQQGTTQNYQGAFAKGEALMVAANALDGVARDKRITLSPSLSWASGIASVNQQSPFGLNTRFDRAASPEAPFATLSFGIKVDDQDGGTTLLANPNMNAAVAGSCAGASCNAVRLGTQKLLYGRLLAGTEAGVASAPLAIPLQMQYYEAGNWQPNKEDQCTRLSLAADGIRFLNPGHSFDAATRDLNLGAGRKIKLGLGSSAPGGEAAQAKDGEILFHFAKPDISVRIPYKVDLAKQPSSPLWLSDPASANDGNLQGEAIFGSSRGNDRIIYRREVLH
ncbi:DUF6701 domain-containing protein [Aeromonas allosaccharophila]|uniref:DUF6701 domain-containing protein n=1 Tax=Aeromonas allosaccharophila TaxID=656 RepID=A0AAX3NW57_9GAMM|nr:DUF6701 domain-containing protein [Aeromonas allosaccharophila]WED76388.1 hypothetical protein PYU98_21340 [Aeromonas allosaccharophila]